MNITLQRNRTSFLLALIAAMWAAIYGAASRAEARGCLAAGTPISTPSGDVAVEKLAVGDAVWSVEGQTLRPARVVARYEVLADTMLEIHVADRILRVTDEHPLQTAPGVFTQAGRLRVGDALFLWRNGVVEAEAITSIKISRVHEPVFNLMVSPDGTYLADGVVVHNKGCFLPDTPILKADGTSVAIHEIRIGDRVAAFLPDGMPTTAIVQAIVTHEVEEYYRLRTDEVTLDVTAEHPFYVGQGTFKILAALREGDEIFAWDGLGLSPQKIISIERIAAHVKVYNLQTDEPHTFFANGIAVHNKGGGFGGGGHSSGGHFGGGGFHSHSYSYSHASYSSAQPWRARNWIWVAIIGGIVITVIAAGVATARKAGPSGSLNLDFVHSRAAIDAKAAQTVKLLEHLARQDASVDPTKLAQMVEATFLQLQRCWEARDYTPMRPLLMPDLYQTHAQQLAAMMGHHEINHIDNPSIDHIDFVNLRYTGNPDQREFTALITATARDYFTDDRSGSFIRGDQSPSQFQEFWVFHRTGERWLLREIDQSRESDALREVNHVEGMSEQEMESICGPMARPAAAWSALTASGKASRLEMMLEKLAAQDSAWDRSALVARVRDVFVIMLLAQESGDLTQARSCIVPPALTDLQDQIAQRQTRGEKIEYRNLCVRKVEITLVQPSSVKTQSSFTARVSAHAQRIVRQTGVTTQSDPYERPFVRFLEMRWSGQDWKLECTSPEPALRV